MEKQLFSLLEQINPCFLVLNNELIIESAGRSMVKIYGKEIIGADFENIFAIERPISRYFLNYRWIVKNQKQLFLINAVKPKKPSLKGQFIELNQSLFLSAIPFVRNIDEMKMYGLNAHDYPIYDSSVDFMLLNELDKINHQELIETHEQLNQSLKQIENLNNELKQAYDEKSMQYDELSLGFKDFTFSVGHDLKAPIRQVSMFTQILMDRLDKLNINDEKVSMFSEHINNSCHKSLNIIDGLYSLTKITQAKIKTMAVDIEELIEKEVKLYKGLKDVAFSLLIDDKAAVVYTDPFLLQIILGNLIGNAVKYKKPNKSVSIKISATIEDSCFMLSVKDNGIGFKSTEASKIFRMFERLPTNREYSDDSSGIGLSVVNTAVLRLGGKIKVDAAPDVGATFTIRLPIV